MKQRTLTAIPLVALMLALIYLRGIFFPIVIVIISILSIREMIIAMKKANLKPFTYTCYIIPVLMFPINHFLGVYALLGLFVFIIIANLIYMMVSPKERFIGMIVTLFIMCYPSALFYSFILMGDIKPFEYSMFIMALALVTPVLSDTGAYLLGSKYGKHKLAPLVSPAKTIEGAFGGLFLGVGFIALLVLIIYQFDIIPTTWSGYDNIMGIAWYHWISCAFVCVVFGQLGDLVASAVKRFAGIKDFSNLFPGHGGMLDRIDSILFSVTVALLYFRIFVI